MPIYIGDKQLPEPNNVVFNGDDTVQVFWGASQIYPTFTGALLTADETQFPAGGGTINLTCQGSGVPPLTFDFQENVNGGGWVSFQNSGSNVASRAVGADNTSFRCVVTDSNVDSVTSNVIQTRVWQIPQFNAGSGPTDKTVPQGQTTSFSVSVTAYQPTYQWRRNGGNISGATSAQYNTPAQDFADNNGDTYDCVVTDGLGQSNTSALATLTVTTPAVSISITPTSVSGNPGDSATWQSSVSGGYGAKALQWRLDNVDIGGQTGASYTRTLATSDDGSFIDCRVSDAAGKTANSNDSPMTVKDNTVVEPPPASILPPGYVNGTGFLYIAEPSKMWNWNGQRPVVGDSIFEVEEFYGNGIPLQFRAAYPQSYAPVLRFSESAQRYYLQGTRPEPFDGGSIYLIYGGPYSVSNTDAPFGWYVGHAIPSNQMVITNMGLMRDFSTNGFNASVVPQPDGFNPNTKVRPDMRLVGETVFVPNTYAPNQPIIGVFGGETFSGSPALFYKRGMIDGQWLPFQQLAGGTPYTNIYFGIPWMSVNSRWYEMTLGWAPASSLIPSQVSDVYNNRRAQYPTL